MTAAFSSMYSHYLLSITIVCRLSIHSVQQWLESHNSGRLAFYAPGRINSSIDPQGSGSCAFLARGHLSANPTSRELARMFRLYLPTLGIPGHQTSSQSRAKVIGSIIAEPCRPP